MQGSQQRGVETEQLKTQDQNMGSNQVELPSFGPVIWSKGGAVGCHRTRGERGWETTGGEDKKEPELWQIWLS